MLRFNKLFVLTAFVAATWCLVPGCDQTESEIRPLKVPRGYVPVLEIEVKDRLLGFGPFVGYYFKPENPGDFNLLEFVCFNERRFYSAAIAENARLFNGQAVLTRLADVNIKLPDANRINPIYFSEAPPQWLQSRPDSDKAFARIIEFDRGPD